MAPKNVFVLGLDSLNHESLRELPDAHRYVFHPLLSVDELVGGESIDLDALLERAKSELDAFDGTISAIIGYWDFPVSSMVPLLCAHLGLPTTSLEAVVKCEHKYWSRIEQEKACAQYPSFDIVELEGDPRPPADVPFPMWVKPVKSFSSDLAFRVADRDEFDNALAEIKVGVGRVGEAFDSLLKYLDLPEEIAEVGGAACMAEAEIGGQQVTVEGYVRDGRVHPQGVIDSINYPDTSSFLRYQYPSGLPDEVLDRLIDVTTRVLHQIGLDNSTFNIEYFWDRDTGALNLIEVNPRLSQSHARLFHAVDGVPNHQSMLRLALGEDPELPSRRGAYGCAGKCFVRRFSDGVVRRVPTDAELAELAERFPDAHVHIGVREGDRLSETPNQDSYSYELATVFVGAADQDELVETHEQVVDRMRFEFTDEEQG